VDSLAYFGPLASASVGIDGRIVVTGATPLDGYLASVAHRVYISGCSSANYTEADLPDFDPKRSPVVSLWEISCPPDEGPASQLRSALTTVTLSIIEENATMAAVVCRRIQQVEWKSPDPWNLFRIHWDAPLGEEGCMAVMCGAGIEPAGTICTTQDSAYVDLTAGCVYDCDGRLLALEIVRNDSVGGINWTGEESGLGPQSGGANCLQGAILYGYSDRLCECTQFLRCVEPKGLPGTVNPLSVPACVVLDCVGEDDSACCKHIDAFGSGSVGDLCLASWVLWAPNVLLYQMTAVLVSATLEDARGDYACWLFPVWAAQSCAEEIGLQSSLGGPGGSLLDSVGLGFISNAIGSVGGVFTGLWDSAILIVAMAGQAVLGCGMVYLWVRIALLAYAGIRLVASGAWRSGKAVTAAVVSLPGPSVAVDVAPNMSSIGLRRRTA
jgi:hypothetical protein